MTSKQKNVVAKPEEVEYPRKAVPCLAGQTGEERGRNYAALITSPELAAHRIINMAEQESGAGEHIDVPSLIETLRAQAYAVNGNDLTQAEAMLMNQATSLQSLFVRLTEQALSSKHPPEFDSYMRMALRAQNQCRTTIDTLSAIKHPPIVYAGQTNIAHGNQQVNNEIYERGRGTERSNGVETGLHQNQQSPTNNESKRNELLTEVEHGAKVDIRSTSSAIRINAAVEALGEVNGSADSGG